MDEQRIAALVGRLDRLERSLRHWRRAAFVALAAATLAAVAGGGPGDDRPRDDDGATLRDRATEISKERLEVSRRALDIIAASIRNGAGLANAVDDVYNWSYRLLGDEIYLSMNPDEPRVEDPEVFLAVSPARFSRKRLAAFEAHYRRMTAWEDRLRPLAQKGTLSRFDFLQIQAHRLQAELLLARERRKEKP